MKKEEMKSDEVGLADVKDTRPASIFADLDKLRLSFGSASFAGAVEILSKVPVRKPQKQEFVRVHPDDAMMLASAIYEDKETRDFYFVAPNMMPIMLGVASPAILVTALSRQNVTFIWPVKVANDNGNQNDWFDTAQQGCELAKKKWVRLAADMSLGGYRIYEAQGQLSEPEWPAKTLQELLEVAFRGKVIDSEDHPVIRRLRGLV
jgi:hypothetical protein